MTREEILNEIRRTAQENGGSPLGRARFERITGITKYELGKYWPRFSAAVREAGFEPNTLTTAYDESFLLEKFVGLTSNLGHVPTRAEMRLQRTTTDPTFPDQKVFERFGSKNELIGKALDFARGFADQADAVTILELAYRSPPVDATGSPSIGSSASYGFVYLVRGHPGEYKIGRTNLVDRRVSELGAISPIEPTLEHEIKTDDPVGVEAYWHARFADKRLRGEWFRLNAADVKAFKRWRRIF